ncbi:MAG: MoxR family ATPase [Candidatus Hydrothermales bacterium]
MGRMIRELEEIREKFERVKRELSKTIVGQEEVINQILIALIAKGHALIVGVPGLAKTTIVKNLAMLLDLDFRRVQFTPDLMPSDIIGTEMIYENPETRERYFKFVKGPIFTNCLLADEINRTPPKTQSALLEAMQERRVTVAGVTYKLDEPFLVLATQNPIEQEGTYPLPEAQLDRFMLEIRISYPSHEEEIQIAKLVEKEEVKYEKILTKKEIIEIQELAKKIPVPEFILNYAVKVVRETRPETSEIDFVKKYVRYGAGPRASQFLILGSKARALLKGIPSVEVEDINYLLEPVLRHRIILNFYAEAENIKVEDVIDKIKEYVRWEKFVNV